MNDCILARVCFLFSCEFAQIRMENFFPRKVKGLMKHLQDLALAELQKYAHIFHSVLWSS